MRFKISLILMAASLALSSCIKPEVIPDGVVGSVECDLTNPKACGPVACTQVHTNSTTIPVVHSGASACGELLIGKVFTDGSFLEALIGIADDFCAEEGNCTYADAQAISQAKTALRRIKH